MPTLREFFTRDFSKYLTVSDTHKSISIDTEIEYPVRLHIDLEAATMFGSIYVPSEISPIQVAEFYSNEPKHFLKLLKGIKILSGFAPPQEFNEDISRLENDLSITKSDDLIFSGRLFIYSESDVEDEMLADVISYALKREVKLVIRDKKYSEKRSEWEQPKAFICHDSRDKQDVAEKIAVGLQQKLCPVWYDDFSLKIGDSLREKIEDGIKKSSKCVVIISPNFLANSGWTKSEFNAIINREIIQKDKLILPIWHNVTKDDVFNYSPILVDRLAANTNDGIETVIDKIYRAVR